MNPETLRKELEKWAVDEGAQAARTAACRAVADGVGYAGRALYVGGWILRDPVMEGLGVVTEMGAELAAGAVQLFDRELWYAGGALVRQLIEAEYLAWRFADNRSVASSWLRSSPDEIRQKFAPNTMRRESAGHFRDAEYWTHCDHGGHPSPRGRLLLKHHGGPLGSQLWVWADLTQHLERLWDHLNVALVAHKATEVVPDQIRQEVARALAHWHQADLLADRLPLEILGCR